LDEKSATVLFGAFFLVALGRALWHARHREFAQHREWMIRGYAVGLAVATIRPIMGAFFAAAVLRGRVPQPSQFFGTAFWIGFSVQTIVAELWIRSTRTAAPAAELPRVASL
jgi:H+/Cl- antiporter ClcA